jgi:hypothetical protein
MTYVQGFVYVGEDDGQFEGRLNVYLLAPSESFNKTGMIQLTVSGGVVYATPATDSGGLWGVIDAFVMQQNGVYVGLLDQTTALDTLQYTTGSTNTTIYARVSERPESVYSSLLTAVAGTTSGSNLAAYSANLENDVSVNEASYQATDNLQVVNVNFDGNVVDLKRSPSGFRVFTKILTKQVLA